MDIPRSTDKDLDVALEQSIDDLTNDIDLNITWEIALHYA
jgi:hypothetical protein